MELSGITKTTQEDLKDNPMKKNEWYVSSYEYVSWYISISYPKNMNDITKILKLYRDIEKLCYQYRVYMIDEISGVFKATKNFYYTDWIEQQIDKRRVLQSLGVGSYVGYNHNVEDCPQQTILTEVCFYDENSEIKKEIISNIKNLLQQSYTNDGLEDWEIDRQIFDKNNHTLDVSPIYISGDSLYIEDVCKDDKTREMMYMVIKSETNIWFPWILDNLGNLYDNRELAYCHTPRLNHFLLNVKDLISNFGGTFEIDCDSPLYSQQVSDAGILLNDDTPYLG